MRARMALLTCGVEVELREVALKSKPDALLAISEKATVPVLVTETDIFDESIDIMYWALANGGDAPEHWDATLNEAQRSLTQQLIENNDGDFKYWLDRYKYADRYPEYSEEFYRQQGEITLAMIEKRLRENRFLCAHHITLVDIAIFPFIRQFINVNTAWFELAPYPKLRDWLFSLIESDLFNITMHKYKPWQVEDQPILFPSE